MQALNPEPLSPKPYTLEEGKVGSGCFHVRRLALLLVIPLFQPWAPLQECFFRISPMHM